MTVLQGLVDPLIVLDVLFENEILTYDEKEQARRDYFGRHDLCRAMIEGIAALNQYTFDDIIEALRKDELTAAFAKSLSSEY